MGETNKKSLHASDTCVQVSLAAYPKGIRSELNIPPELLILYGLAISYTDSGFPPNHLRMTEPSSGQI